MTNNNRSSVFHAPLQDRDTATTTVGCRHTNPNICAKHSMERVCAFIRDDGMCITPPLSWARQFLLLAKDRLSNESESGTSR